MFKKIVSIAIAAMMLGSTAVIAASAAEGDEAVAAADDSSAVAAADDSSVGAEDGSEATSAGSKIYFDASSSGWKTYKAIYLYLYDHNNGEIITWGSKKGKMTDEGNNKWSYDLDAKGISFDSSNAYGCIFTADWGMQTCDLIIGSPCIGDTAVCTGETVENNVDSNKTSYVVKWTNADSSTYGNPKCITSIGNVIGNAYWPGDSGYAMFVKFLSSTGKDGIDNALKFNGKNTQQTIDDTANALGLGKEDIKKAIAESGRTFDWKEDSSKAKDGGGSSDNNNNNNNNTNTNTNTNNGGGTSNGGGSNSVTSGEDTTVYFIIGGVMLAAIGVLFLARKRRQY